MLSRYGPQSKIASRVLVLTTIGRRSNSRCLLQYEKSRVFIVASTGIKPIDKIWQKSQSGEQGDAFFVTNPASPGQITFLEIKEEASAFGAMQR
jgi:hypothetical protein